MGETNNLARQGVMDNFICQLGWAIMFRYSVIIIQDATIKVVFFGGGFDLTFELVDFE